MEIIISNHNIEWQKKNEQEEKVQWNGEENEKQNNQTWTSEDPSVFPSSMHGWTSEL